MRLEFKLVFLFATMLFFASSYAVSDTLHYTAANGLPSNIIYKIAQTPDGFIWLATDAGLVRFDGHSFKNYTTLDGLPENEIISIASDKANRLIISPYQADVCYLLNGIICTGDSDNNLKRFRYRANSNPPFLPVSSSRFEGAFVLSGDSLLHYSDNGVALLSTERNSFFYENADSTIVILTSTECFYHKGDKVKRYPLNKSITSFINQKSHHHFATIYNNHIYLVADERICKITEIAEGQFKWNTEKNLDGLSIVNTFDFYPDYGLLISDRLNKIYAIDTSLTCRPFNLNSESLNAVLVDRDSNLWLGTVSNGLYLIIKNKDPYTQYIYKDDATCIFNDNQNRLWIGDASGNVKCLKDGKIILERKVSNERIRQIIYTGKDSVLFVLADAAIIIGKVTATGFERHNFLPDATPKRMCRVDSSIAIATAGGLIRYRNGNLEGPFMKARYTSITAIDNEIFTGTFTGLYKTADCKNLKDISSLDLALKSHITILSSSVDSILWIALSSGKVLAWKNKVIGELSTATDFRFSYGSIRNLLAGPGRNIWISTDNGLYRFLWEVINGRLHIKFQQRIKLQSISNDIWATDSFVYVASNTGIEKIIFATSETEPPINTIITGLSVNDSSVALQQNYIFSYRQNSVGIDFTGIQFGKENEIIYQYKLEGTDSKWNYTSLQHVQYNALRPGRYTFKVTAYDANNNLLTKSVAVSFNINPPFYLCAWFIALCALTLVGIVFFATSQWNKFKTQKKEQRLELQRTIYDLEHKALLAQMNPHFIFNALTSVQAYANQKDIENFNRFLSSFSKLIRQTLEISGQPKIKLRDEIAYLESYIGLEKMRFKRFTYQIKCTAGAENIEILPMIIQPFVENSINHGLLLKSDDDGVLTVDFSVTNNYLQVVIEDNGIGRKAAVEKRKLLSPTHKSKGMEVTMNRINAYNEINNNKIDLQIIDKMDAENNPLGTKIILKFPL